ncbi:hypothetical protein Glove_91g142 [Diversispora epigaea]|uniref:non-specific serine/threonine protein kinase n=1 Tax=Diversispora epigaea TaxID=1348612 RepID=A0A397J7V4_9GLOM|nr:hypothetical protein Glove_91g142 [Diversispora epigaea]
MSQEKTNEKEWKAWMDNLIIEDTLRKEKISFYRYSEFEYVKLIHGNVYKATFKTSQKTVALKCILLNDKFTLDNLINEIKRYRKLEIHDSILRFYGITKQENTDNYMIILECAIFKNKISKTGLEHKTKSCKTNYQCFDNSENIFVHNENIKFNVFELTKVMPESLKFLTNTLGPIQYIDPQYLKIFNTIGKNKSSDIFSLEIILWEISSGNLPFKMESLSNADLLNNITKGKREIAIPGTLPKYKEILMELLLETRDDISQVVKNLSEIIISDASFENETPQSQPQNIMDEIISSTELEVFIKDLFEKFFDIIKKQFVELQSIMMKNYIKEHKKNSVEVLYEMIRHPSHFWFTSMIGFFTRMVLGQTVTHWSNRKK